MNNIQKQVFFVEDDILLLEVMEKFLRQAGYSVVIAKDGAEAVEALKTVTPHLILLDILLPHIDGFEILKHIKEDPRISSVPVVILSNYGSENDVKKGLELGAREYLVKASLTPEEIVDRVKKILGEL